MMQGTGSGTQVVSPAHPSAGPVVVTTGSTDVVRLFLLPNLLDPLASGILG
jgi:hypothetical protein